MNTVNNVETKESRGWNSLEELENSPYKTVNSPELKLGSRPTIKTMKHLDSLTSKENSHINEGVLKSDNDVRVFIDQIALEEKKRLIENPIKKKVESLNGTNEDIINSEKLKSNSRKKVVKGTLPDIIKEVFLGFGRLYINKTNNILNPLRFVMDNKIIVARAILLFIIPAVMTWYFTTQVSSIQMQLAKENLLIQSLYAVIFYFANMFVLFTALIVSSFIWNGLKESLVNAQEAGKN